MTPSSKQRVVITGLGVVSPLGSDLETLWKNLIAGKSGISKIESLPAGTLPVQSGGEVKDFTGKIEDYGPLDKPLQRAIKKNMKVMCREIEMGVAAAQKALAHSGLGADRDPDRCGCLFGCDYILTRPEEFADGLRNCMAHSGGNFHVEDWPEHGLPKVNPLWLLKYLPNMPNSHVSIYNEFRGPNNSITVREASMNLSVAESAAIIRRGAADAILVGATGSRIHPLRTTHVTLIERLASAKPDPGQMSRPFDATCDGMVLGEGAGALMLESLEHASARGAKIWGEIVAEGAAMAGPRPGRDHLRDAIRGALGSAMTAAGDRLPNQWHLHAQGLSDPEADASEGRAIGDILEGKKSIPVTAAKSYFGNLGAGSAAVEIICSLLALERGELFALRNLQTPGEYVTWQPAVPGSSAGQAVLHSSFSMQGQAAALVVTGA